MSGGHFNYDQDRIGRIAESIQTLIENNDSTERNQWGDPIGWGYPTEIIARFREAVTALHKAAVYAHRVDYLVSGDDGEESFLRRLAEDLDELERQG